MRKWTKGPWRVEDDCEEVWISTECPEESPGDIICEQPSEREFPTSFEKWPANAARIVQCVNGFDALVEALTNLLGTFDIDRVASQAGIDQAISNARTALANASPKKTSSNLLPPSTSNPEGK